MEKENEQEDMIQRYPLKILYRDSWLVAVEKPHGLLVHLSSLAPGENQACLQLLRDQIGCKVYPVHRLDRQTSGALLFALDENTNSKMQKMFSNYEVRKVYKALVRGYTADEGTIDSSLRNDKGNEQEALTAYSTEFRFEIPIPLGNFSTSRYSLVKVVPKTGRTHQIRRHMARISHPIIGDRRHGCNRQNNLFRDHESLGLDTMLLHADSLSFVHPVTNNLINIQAEFQSPFQHIMNRLTELAVRNSDEPSEGSPNVEVNTLHEYEQSIDFKET